MLDGKEFQIPSTIAVSYTHLDVYKRQGLGLAICKKIIDAHKGKIYAENKEIGVTFYILMNNDKAAEI